MALSKPKGKNPFSRIASAIPPEGFNVDGEPYHPLYRRANKGKPPYPDEFYGPGKVPTNTRKPNPKPTGESDRRYG